jgi:hypothetical protein
MEGVTKHLTECPSCHRPIDDEDDAFCQHCGASLSAPTAEVEPPGETSAETTEAKPGTVPFGTYAPSTTVANGQASGRLKLWIILGSVAAAGLLVAGVAFALVANRAGPEKKLQTTSVKPSPVFTTEPSEVEVQPSPTADNRPPTDAKEITTSQGVLHIESARLTNKYTECPIGGGSCKTVSGGNKYILILILKSVEGRNSQEFHDKIAVEASESYVKTPDGQTIALRSVGGIPPNSSTELIFSYFYSADGSGLIFYWPGNAPIRLVVGNSGASSGGSQTQPSKRSGSVSDAPAPAPPPEESPPEEPPPEEPPPDE